jgi:hypothetical protein
MTIEITEEFLVDLNLRALVAQSGPWRITEKTSQESEKLYGIDSPHEHVLPPLKISRQDAAFIAEANPETIIALIEQIKRLNRRYDEQKLLATRMIEHAAGQGNEITTLSRALDEAIAQFDYSNDPAWRADFRDRMIKMAKAK